MPISNIEEALEDIREGKIIILVDDEDRENEGDFMVASEKVTPEIINFMALHGRGLLRQVFLQLIVLTPSSLPLMRTAVRKT